MTISGLTKGRVFGESQIAKSDFPRLRPERAPPHQGGFRVSGLLDLLAESQITATPRHSAPGAGACQPAQRSGHQGRRLVWAPAGAWVRPEHGCYAVTEPLVGWLSPPQQRCSAGDQRHPREPWRCRSLESKCRASLSKNVHSAPCRLCIETYVRAAQHAQLRAEPAKFSLGHRSGMVRLCCQQTRMGNHGYS